MREADRTQKMAWLLAAASGIVALVVVIMLFRSPSGPVQAPSSAPGRPSVGVASTDPVLSEEAALFDRTPLFLPTEWNSTEKELPRQEPGGEFIGFPDKMTFTDNELNIILPSPIKVPGRLVDELASNPSPDLLLGVGRTEYIPPALASRGAYVEIMAAGTGRKVLVQALPDAQPPGDGTWQPLEFMVAVDAAGLVGSPVLTVRSGAEEVDVYFRKYLAESFRVGDRLEPGFYRISVGP